MNISFSQLPFILSFSAIAILVFYMIFLRNEKNEKRFLNSIWMLRALTFLGYSIRSYQVSQMYLDNSNFDYLPFEDVFLVVILLFYNLEYYLKFLYNQGNHEEKYSLDKEFKKVIMWNIFVVLSIAIVQCFRIRVWNS